MSKPTRVKGIPQNAQWLSGEGAGSWFSILPAEDDKFEITRVSPLGETECRGIFKTTQNLPFYLDKPYRINYLSHCRKVVIVQDNKKIVLTSIQKVNSPEHSNLFLHSGILNEDVEMILN